MHIEQALEKFLLQLVADGRSPHTIGQYRRHINLLALWARDVGHSGNELERLGHEDVARFLSAPAATERVGGGAKKATAMNCLRSSVRTFLSHCHRAGYLAQDPGQLIRRARCMPPPPRGLSKDDQRRLLETLAQANGSEAERDYMLIHLLLAVGIRIGSALALDLEDVDLPCAQLTIRRTKGDAPDLVFLNDAIRVHLERFLAGRAAGPLFLAKGARISQRHAQRRLKQWLKAAGVTSKASCHSLRHSFAARVYERSRDILVVKAALGHRSVASTLVYVQVDEVRLRAVI